MSRFLVPIGIVWDVSTWASKPLFRTPARRGSKLHTKNSSRKHMAEGLDSLPRGHFPPNSDRSSAAMTQARGLSDPIAPCVPPLVSGACVTIEGRLRNAAKRSIPRGVVIASDPGIEACEGGCSRRFSRGTHSLRPTARSRAVHARRDATLSAAPVPQGPSSPRVSPLDRGARIHRGGIPSPGVRGTRRSRRHAAVLRFGEPLIHSRSPRLGWLHEFHVDRAAAWSPP